MMNFNLSFDSYSPAVKRKSDSFIENGSKRRKFSTKNCPECTICSDEVFEVCHPHISTVEMLKKKKSWCQICQKNHANDDALSDRKKLVLGSSTLAHLWKTNGYKEKCKFHVDFDCIIGGQIHDVHLSFLRQYKDNESPMDIILACGMNNIPTTDTAEDIQFQFMSFLSSISEHSIRHQHKKPNRVVICPLLYAPKFTDKRLNLNENFTDKIIAINEWIHDFNMNTNDNINLNLDQCGVEEIPKNAKLGVKHVYNDWNEPQWSRMLHLSPATKSRVAQDLLNIFAKLDKQ